MNALQRAIATIPKSLSARDGSVLYALLLAIAESDDNIAAAIQAAATAFPVKKASGRYLEILGRNYGVSKPATLGLSDDDFRQLIPNLSLKPKTIKKAFYDTADVFWGPLFSRANITSLNSAPFNVSVGDSITVSIDGKKQQTVKVLTGEIATNGAATAEEMVAILSKINKATVTIQRDAVLDVDRLNIRTNTPGSVGSVEIFTSSMIGPTKLDFPIGNYDILDLNQRVSIYQIKHNELLIELPSVIPALRRTLKGSHHFHEDATLESPVPPANGVWEGSFFFDPNGSTTNFTVTSQKSILQQNIVKGQVYTGIAVDDNSNYKNQSGMLVFDYGLNTQEGPVKYRALPNSNTILIDPSYVFKFNHDNTSTINVISQQKPYVPRKNGDDLAIYFTSPSEAREIVQGILISLAAAGVLVKFKILAPDYKYVIDNPYISDDDAPST